MNKEQLDEMEYDAEGMEYDAEGMEFVTELEMKLSLVYDEDEYSILFNGSAYVLAEEDGSMTLYDEQGTELRKMGNGVLMPIIDKHDGDVSGYVVVSNKHIDDYVGRYREEKSRLWVEREESRNAGELKEPTEVKMVKIANCTEQTEILTEQLTLKKVDMEIIQHNGGSPKLSVEYRGLIYESIPDFIDFEWVNWAFK